jgi:hypothetical protein
MVPLEAEKEKIESELALAAAESGKALRAEEVAQQNEGDLLALAKCPQEHPLRPYTSPVRPSACSQHFESILRPRCDF